MSRLLSFVMHCPDTHLVYDGSTPDNEGVGGGVTARIRLAEALAALGHRVEMLCNTSTATQVNGVRYTPLSKSDTRACDVLIAISTGGALDLTAVSDAGHRSSLVLVWVQGFVPIRGLRELAPARVVCCSGYIRDVAERDWGLPPDQLAVVHNGVTRGLVDAHAAREPHRLLYTSHPSKGLDSAVAVLRLLRDADPSWTLAVAGGAALWGQPDAPLALEDGLVDLGLLGQQRLATEYWRSSFSLHLQEFEEPFGISLVEARAAGCVPVASAVGAFPELVRQGQDGWLLEGDCNDPAVQRRAADLILTTAGNPGLREHLTASTTRGVHTWDVLARTWEGLVHHLLQTRGAPQTSDRLTCPADGRPVLSLADGHHCLTCGRMTTSALVA